MSRRMLLLALLVMLLAGITTFEILRARPRPRAPQNVPAKNSIF